MSSKKKLILFGIISVFIIASVTVSFLLVYFNLKYTVTFETNCDEKIEPQIVKKGDLVVEPDAINKTSTDEMNYTFGGWYDGWDVANSVAAGNKVTGWSAGDYADDVTLSRAFEDRREI